MTQLTRIDAENALINLIVKYATLQTVGQDAEIAVPVQTKAILELAQAYGALTKPAQTDQQLEMQKAATAANIVSTLNRNHAQNTSEEA